jgi:hypothetical protein
MEYLFPTKKVLAAYENFAMMAKFASGHITVNDLAANVEKAYLGFEPFHKFYVALREGFDRIASEFKEWNKTLDGVLVPENLLAALGQSSKKKDREVPESCYNWILNQVKETFRQLNCVECSANPQEKNYELESTGKQINEFLVELSNTRNLTDVALLARALCSKIQQVNEMFKIYRIPEVSRTVSSGTEYLTEIRKIYEFASESQLVEYEFCNGRAELIGRVPKQPNKQLAQKNKGFWGRLRDRLRYSDSSFDG